MELDERTKERINNYFNSVSSGQLFKLAVKYNIREAIEWGQTKGKTLPIDSVVGSADIEDDTIMTDEEIEWHVEQERKARKTGMTREQILNGEHHDIIF
jgi:hypothetical protein